MRERIAGAPHPGEVARDVAADVAARDPSEDRAGPESRVEDHVLGKGFDRGRPDEHDHRKSRAQTAADERREGDQRRIASGPTATPGLPQQHRESDEETEDQEEAVRIDLEPPDLEQDRTHGGSMAVTSRAAPCPTLSGR